MTKTEYRVPAPRLPDDMLRRLSELRAWMLRQGFQRARDLGDLAMLDTIGSAQIEDGAVSLGDLADIAANRLLGRITAGTGQVEAVTPAQATAMLQVFTDLLQGLVPASGGGTVNFLRADGAWTPGPVTVARLGTRSIKVVTTGSAIAGLTVPLVAGTYQFRYHLICQANGTGTGLSFGINYTGTTTFVSAARLYFGTGTTASTGVMDDSAATLTGQLVEHMTTQALSTTAPNLGPNTGAATSLTNCLNIVEGTIEVSDAGNLELYHASEAAVATSVEVGSSLVLTRVG